jgi:hypothetical protein
VVYLPETADYVFHLLRDYMGRDCVGHYGVTSELVGISKRII